MIHDTSHIRSQLAKWVKQQGHGATGRLTDACDLLGEGFIDSLGLMELISHVEELRDRPFNDDEMRMEHFRSIDSIVESLFGAPPRRRSRPVE